MRLTESDLHHIVLNTVRTVLKEAFDGNKVILYHGTPHKFDRFSMGKINTGQHSQDFGKGLYFTTDKETAKFYANELSHTMSLKDKFDYTVHSFKDKDGLFTDYLEKNYSLMVKRYVQRYMEEGVGDPAEWKEFLDLMNKTMRYAYIYTVEIVNPKFMERSEYIDIQRRRNLSDDEMNKFLLASGYNGIMYDMNTRKCSSRDFTGEKNVVIIDDSAIKILDREFVTFDYIMKLKI